MNDNNNNFSLIRNKEINRIGPDYLHGQFYAKYNVHEFFKVKNKYEDQRYVTNYSKIWTRQNYTHQRVNKLVNYDYTKQYLVLNIETFLKDKELINQKNNDILFLSNTLTDLEIIDILTKNNLEGIKFHTFKDPTSIPELINIFMLLHKNDNCTFEIIE